ncbi:hypothetical protein FF38_11598 [Lucilia cuprina]|uniref:INO80 complex subunit F domain-containing protein n=1 Tax=Lucilia cuprina TaxID=7375 RepID=A0A0L0BVE5_LUCCU|nr:hypothetical protein FF38_11598 [Lucilia cuprina]
MLLDDKQQKYKQFVDKLLQRCQEIQTENERHVLRINTIKKLIRRRVRDVELLKRRLDQHNDNWRALPMVAPHPKRKIEQKRGPKPKNKDCNAQDQKEKKVRKQRVKKNGEDKPNNNNANNTSLAEVQDMLEQTRYQESQAQQLLMMQQRQLNLKNDQLL